MIIAGIGDVTHDPSVYLLKNTQGNLQILAGIESERLSRIKHGLKPDPQKYNLLEQGLDFQQSLLSQKAREESLNDCLNYCLKAASEKLNKSNQISHIFISSLFEKAAFKSRTESSVHLLKITHHLAHAASSFYTSPFESSAILAIDGYGMMAADHTSDSVLFAHGEKNLITPLLTIRGKAEQTPEEIKLNLTPGHMVFSNSLGVFYQNITLLLGLGYFNEGKTMGLSAYGKLNPKYQCIEDWIKFNTDGTVSINNREIFLLVTKWIQELQATNTVPPNPHDKKFQAFADLAFIHQALLEKMIFHLCHGLYQRTGETRLCLTGGVALNSVANGKIIANTPFKAIHLIPPTGDNGIGLGAGLYGAHQVLNLPRTPLKKFNPYLGKIYTASDIQESCQPYLKPLALEPTSLPAEISAETGAMKSPAKKNLSPIPNPNHLSATALAAQLISEGKIIGWFSGGAEIGPRALGNRSILADPRSKTMRDYLNLEVKHREFFRPFAPACLPEDFKKYFTPALKNLSLNPPDASLGGIPFMLEIREATPQAVKTIPAVIHIDQTARVQEVDPEINPVFYELIQEFKKISGIGILLNTSFNGPHEPIIETPDQAIQCFLNLNLDALFLNGQGFFKPEYWAYQGFQSKKT